MKISQGLGTKFKQIIIDIDAQKASISIYKVDDVPSGSNTGDAYVVSGDDIWLPGVFDSRVAALLFASMLTPDQQEQIWADESHNPGAPEEGRILDADDVCSALNELLGCHDS